jgi:hypothetical protein
MEGPEHWPVWAEALQESALGLAIRNALWIYPLANILHVFGVILLVGPIVALDLRLLGIGKFIPAASASRFLTPFAVTGLLLIVPSGSILFIADAGPLAADPLMQTKIALVLLGLANAALFRHWWSGRLRQWDANPHGFGRAQAAASIAIWFSVPALGRLIAYF